MIERFFSVAEVSALLNVSPWTIRRLARNGTLKSVRFFSQYRFPQSAIDALMRKTVKPEPQLLTVNQVAEYIKSPPERVRLLIQTGVLPSQFDENGYLVVSKKDVLQFMEQNR